MTEESHGRRPAFDPTPGTSGPRDLSKNDVTRVSQALLLLISVVERLTAETADNPPPRGSNAYRLWNGPESGYAIDGLITMQYANMSAMDHARAFVALIRTPTVRSTALATVARGTHESLARTWYLSAYTADEDFLYRVICLLRSDLRFSELLQEAIRTRDGDPVDPAQKRAYYARELTRLNLPAPHRPDMSSMVAAMLDAEFDDEDGRRQYSALSSIAHAHRLGLNTFVVTNEDGVITGLSAPRAIVVDMAIRQVGALHGTGKAFIDFYGGQARHTDLLRTAMSRALHSLEPIADSIWPLDDSRTENLGSRD